MSVLVTAIWSKLSAISIVNKYREYSAWISQKASKLESYLIVFEGLLLEDMDSFSTYIERRLMIFAYQFALLMACLQYVTVETVTSLGRALFSVLFIYITSKIVWHLPNSNMNFLRTWAAIDAAAGYILNILVNTNDSIKYNIIVIYLGVAFCYFSKSSTNKVLLGICATLINSYTQMFSGRISSYVINMFSLYFFLFAIGQSHHIINDEFAKRFAEARKNTEKELQNKNMFVASISHDLKNPLNSLLGCLDLLKASPTLSNKDKGHLLTASYSGQILHYLIGNILDVSKIEAGKFDIDRLPMDLMEEVKKIVMIESELSKKKGITLHQKVLTAVPKMVYGDAMRFAQVLINIIGNSIKFTSRGYVGLLIRWANSIDEAKGHEEPSDGLIPPEEYFTMPQGPGSPAIASAATVQYGRHAQSEDYTDCLIMDEFTESIHDKISKYNKPIQSKGGRRDCGSSYTINSPTPFPNTGGKREIGPSRFMQAIQGKKQIFTEAHDQNAAAPQSHKFRPPIQSSSPYEEQKTITGDSGVLVVDIVDTGIGLSEEEQKRLFKPFNQANNAVKAKYGGTGLGLWITKQLAYLMSGFIELRSQSGKGTRFTITLPFKIIHNEEPYSAMSPEIREQNLLTSSYHQKTISKNVTDLRTSGKMSFKGSNKLLKRMNVLLIEDAFAREDCYLEQILNQLLLTDCRLSYTTYTNAQDVLKTREYRFEALIVISSQSITSTMKFVATLMKANKDSGYKQIPLSIALGMSCLLAYSNLYQK